MDRAEIIAEAKTLIHTMDLLANVLEVEVRHLYTSKSKELEVFYKQKAALLTNYTAGMTALQNAATDKDGKVGKLDLPADLTHELKQHSKHLMDVMDRNMRAIAVAEEASRKVVEVIIDAVKKQRTTGAAYGVNKDGALTIPPASEAATQAVTFDTRL